MRCGWCPPGPTSAASVGSRSPRMIAACSSFTAPNTRDERRRVAYGQIKRHVVIREQRAQPAAGLRPWGRIARGARHWARATENARRQDQRRGPYPGRDDAVQQQAPASGASWPREWVLTRIQDAAAKARRFGHLDPVLGCNTAVLFQTAAHRPSSVRCAPRCRAMSITRIPFGCAVSRRIVTGLGYNSGHYPVLLTIKQKAPERHDVQGPNEGIHAKLLRGRSSSASSCAEGRQIGRNIGGIAFRAHLKRHLAARAAVHPVFRAGSRAGLAHR